MSRHDIQYNLKGSDRYWIAHIHYRAKKATLAAAKDAQKQIAIQGIT